MTTFEEWDNRPAYEVVTEALASGGSEQSDKGLWTCPAHNDVNPSLSVTEKPDRALVHCFAGCSAEDVVTELNLSLAHLFNASATYDYTDEDGKRRKQVERLPGKQFRQKGDTKAVLLYRLPEVMRAVAAGRTVYLVEGEKDAETLRCEGVAATTCSGGGEAIGRADLSPLHGAHVIAVIDADDAGDRWARKVLAALGDTAGLLEFRQAKAGKDVTDHLLAGHPLDDLTEMEPSRPTLHEQAVEEALVKERVRAEVRDLLALEQGRMGGTGGAGWGALDVAGVLAGLADGTVDRPEPTLGCFGDGCLFYPGRINSVHGDSTAGKSWTALITTAQEIAKGETVVYVDLEDSMEGLLARLVRDLGVDPDAVAKRLVYLHPDEPLTAATGAGLRALLAERQPSLVVLDSTGEALALAGVNPNADDEVARWFTTLPRLAVEEGAAVLLLDHATKAGDNDLWPIGSQRKRAAVTGAAYLQKVATPFSRDQDGKSVLICAKDRHGNYPLRRRVAALQARGGGLSLVAESSVGGDFQPTGYMERVSKALEAAIEPLSTSKVEDAVGNRANVGRALAALVKDGYVTVKPGARGAKLHTSLRPYREDGEDKLL